jgi:hypothetical protein
LTKYRESKIRDTGKYGTYLNYRVGARHFPTKTLGTRFA